MLLSSSARHYCAARRHNKRLLTGRCCCVRVRENVGRCTSTCAHRPNIVLSDRQFELLRADVLAAGTAASVSEPDAGLPTAIRDPALHLLCAGADQRGQQYRAGQAAAASDGACSRGEQAGGEADAVCPAQQCPGVRPCNAQRGGAVGVHLTLWGGSRQSPEAGDNAAALAHLTCVAAWTGAVEWCRSVMLSPEPVHQST